MNILTTLKGFVRVLCTCILIFLAVSLSALAPIRSITPAAHAYSGSMNLSTGSAAVSLTALSKIHMSDISMIVKKLRQEATLVNIKASQTIHLPKAPTITSGVLRNMTGGRGITIGWILSPKGPSSHHYTQIAYMRPGVFHNNFFVDGTTTTFTLMPLTTELIYTFWVRECYPQVEVPTACTKWSSRLVVDASKGKSHSSPSAFSMARMSACAPIAPGLSGDTLYFRFSHCNINDLELGGVYAAAAFALMIAACALVPPPGDIACGIGVATLGGIVAINIGTMVRDDQACERVGGGAILSLSLSSGLGVSRVC